MKKNNLKNTVIVILSLVVVIMGIKEVLHDFEWFVPVAFYLLVIFLLSALYVHAVQSRVQKYVFNVNYKQLYQKNETYKSLVTLLTNHHAEKAEAMLHLQYDFAPRWNDSGMLFSLLVNYVDMLYKDNVKEPAHWESLIHTLYDKSIVFRRYLAQYTVLSEIGLVTKIDKESSAYKGLAMYRGIKKFQKKKDKNLVLVKK